VSSIKHNIERKIRYNSITGNSELLSVYDNWDSEQALYGRINHRNRPIAPLNRETMTQITQQVMAFNFVADAFADLGEHYREKVINGLEPYADMDLLVPSRGYQNPRSLFADHQDRLSDLFFRKYLIPHSQHIHNFEQFFKHYMNFAREYARDYPVTYSAFVESKFCSPIVSALSLDLQDFSHDDDSKRREMVEHPTFNFFAKLAKEYGFVIPLHAPLTIVANLDSQTMINYAIQYDIFDKEELLSQYYYECKDHDIDIFKVRIADMYKVFMEEFTVVSEPDICANGTFRYNTRERFENVEANSRLPTNIPQSFWYKNYLRIRLMELGQEVNKKRFDKLFKECYFIFNQYNFDTSILYAERKILKTKPDLYR
jgi:hypothetical protein